MILFSLSDTLFKLDVISDDIRVTLQFGKNTTADQLEEALIVHLLDESPIGRLIGIVKHCIGDRDDPAVLANDLPGVHLKAKHPVTNREERVKAIIISLNDVHKWSPNQVADWLENTLPLEEMTFETPAEVNNGENTLQEIAVVAKAQRVLPC